MNRFNIKIKKSGCEVIGLVSNLGKVLNDMVSDGICEVDFTLNGETKKNIGVRNLMMQFHDIK